MKTSLSKSDPARNVREIPSRRSLSIAVLVATLVFGQPFAAWELAGDQANLANPTSPAQAAGPRIAENDAGHEYIAGEILVGFEPGTASGRIEEARQGLGAQRVRRFEGIRAEHWRIPPGLGVEAAVRVLSANPNVRYAEPNYVVRAHEFSPPPNDPLRGDLWGLHNIGQTGGTLGADIRALEAWQVQQGSPGVVVAVIDSGIDYTHPDLAGNIWINPNEEVNGSDTDGNGYIDDIRGWNFVNDTHDPFDDNRHGTHVAGTVGALADNGLGVVGVSPTVTLMPLKFLSSSGFGSTADAVRAVLYAASFKDAEGNPIVRISNNSWGGGGKSQALEDAIRESGALFIASAGNAGSSSLQYPAGYDLPNVIAVAATDHHDGLASFSNHGSWVHLGAPGVGILSTTPNETYRVLSGTSMAAPHVAGAAALLMAQHPEWDNAAIKAHLLATVDLLPSLAGKTVSGGRLNIGTALNAPSLPQDSIEPGKVTDVAVVPEGIDPESIQLTWTATGNDGNVGTAYAYELRYRPHLEIDPDREETWLAATRAWGVPAPQAAEFTEVITVTGLAPGTTYWLAVRVYDEAGNVSPISNAVEARTSSTGWRVDVVDAAGNVGFYRSLAFDHDGNPAIAYSDATEDRVRLATRTGDGWSFAVVGSGHTGVSLAFDPLSGQPTVAWAPNRLNFATRTASGGWSTTAIEKNNVQGDVTSLAYDMDGRPAISYRMLNRGGALRFASRDGNSWVRQDVHPGAGARYSSLAFDSEGNPAIAYSHDDSDNGTLDTLVLIRGARSGDGFVWGQPEYLETGVNGYGVFCSLAFDPITDRPVVVHRANNVVRVLRETDAGAWEVDVVDTGSYTSLAIAADGTVHVAYRNDDQLRVASRGPNDPDWTITLADSEVSVLWQTSIQLDPQAVPFVAYQHFSRRELRLAWPDESDQGPTVVYADDMEFDQGWTTEGNAFDNTQRNRPPSPGDSNLWHLTTRRGTDPGHSPMNSWYYGIEVQGNYDTGTRNWGRLISPVIDLSEGGSRAELRFAQLVHLEGGNYESAILQISANDGPWQEVFRRSTRSTSFITDTVDLTPFLGQTIRLGFYIDTRDRMSNHFEGWYVDDVIVRVWP